MFKTFFPVRQVLNPKTFFTHTEKPRPILPPMIKWNMQQCPNYSEIKKRHGVVKQSSQPFSNLYRQNDLLSSMNKKLDHLRQDLIKFNHDNNNRLSRIAKINEEELGKIVQKMDESANSRLTIFAGYATILSLLLAVLIFLYQQQQEQEKEQSEQKIQDEQTRLEAEKTQGKIDKIRLQYSGLLTTKKAIEDNIDHLENRLKNLCETKNHYWFSFLVPSSIEMSIIKLQGDIEEKKIALQLTLNKINKLDLYVLKQKELEEAEIQHEKQASQLQNEADRPSLRLL